MNPKILIINFEGYPQPFPKGKNWGTGSWKHAPQDKHGFKRAWAERVRLEAQHFMCHHGLELFPKDTPVLLGCNFYYHRARTSKKLWPTQVPDFSNLKYAIENAIKGVVYHDDSQVVGSFPDIKRWTGQEQPEGAQLVVCDVSGAYSPFRVHTNSIELDLRDYEVYGGPLKWPGSNGFGAPQPHLR